jgi:biopolymer transport protein ExbB/TolQ
MKNLSRPIVALIFLGIAIVIITILTFALPEKMAKIALDRHSTIFLYPFTIQNVMIVLFFIGLGELFVRWQDSRQEMVYLKKGYLPEDDTTVLQARDLATHVARVKNDIKHRSGFLPKMIYRCILQFQATRSIEQANEIMNSMVDIYFHQIDMKYTLLRYIAWVIPTFGFIGTIVGIAAALKAVDPANLDLLEVTATLAVAFNTTLIALLLSAVLVFFIHIIQEMEERSLNESVDYCLANLINRLYVAD